MTSAIEFFKRASGIAKQTSVANKGTGEIIVETPSGELLTVKPGEELRAIGVALPDIGKLRGVTVDSDDMREEVQAWTNDWQGILDTRAAEMDHTYMRTLVLTLTSNRNAIKDYDAAKARPPLVRQSKASDLFEENDRRNIERQKRVEANAAQVRKIAKAMEDPTQMAESAFARSLKKAKEVTQAKIDLSAVSGMVDRVKDKFNPKF